MDTAYVQTLRPPCGGLHVDKFAGRVIVSYPAQKPISFGWTRRGHFECARLCLSRLWQWHADATQELIPDLPWQ